MVKSVVSKVMWAGRTTVFLVGLSVILAVIFGVASTALGADGELFLLGKRNVASSVSKLVKRGAGPALNLKVGSGPPLAVNSDAKVANLNAESAGFADAAAQATNADNADKLGGEDLEDILPGGTLPSDTTIRGTYNLYDEAHINEDATSGSISFGYTLASKPTVRVIEEGESLTSECPQRGDDFTGEVPEAAPGFLCIYEWDEENERNGSGYPFISNTNRMGTGIALRSEGTGIFLSEGVWAVTAP